jgi:hypothetical protein
MKKLLIILFIAQQSFARECLDTDYVKNILSGEIQVGSVLLPKLNTTQEVALKSGDFVDVDFGGRKVVITTMRYNFNEPIENTLAINGVTRADSQTLAINFAEKKPYTHAYQGTMFFYRYHLDPRSNETLDINSLKYNLGSHVKFINLQCKK